jgi:transcriptional regulator
MYIPQAFLEKDPEVMREVLLQYPLATVACLDDSQQLCANHLPLLLVGECAPGGELIGHVARGNPLWQWAEALGSIECLCVFTGANHYITPSWYPTKARTHEVVPTYNYASVHIRGQLSPSHDEGAKREAITALTQQMESPRVTPWAVTDAPEPFIEKMMGAIVAIRIKIDWVECKVKASQNQPAINQQGVLDGLQDSVDSNAKAMATYVAKHLKS